MKNTEKQNLNNIIVNGLVSAARKGSREKVEEYLKKNNIPIDYLDGDGATALVIACSRGLLDAVKILHECGSSINIVPGGRFLPLNDAGLSGNLDVINYLIEQGADVNARLPGDYACPLIHNWCQHAPLQEEIEILLKAGADPNTRTNEGETPLMIVSWFERPEVKEDLEVMKILLKYGADPNLKDNNDCTALDTAIKKKSADKIQFLKSLNS